MHERALRWPGNNSSGLMSLFGIKRGGACGAAVSSVTTEISACNTIPFY